MSGPLRVTVGIKALNEEAHIAAAITSALAAVAPFAGEVVLADSGSSDRTLAIAAGYPAVRVVQLADSSERCCGAGAQLAWQTARGDYFYLLDGDMVLDAGFLKAGIAFLDAHPDYAGVGGIVWEANVTSIEYQARRRNAEARNEAFGGDVDRLDCGGLYRASAIAAQGYFADRNLHAFEEFELGARLAAAGWKLARLPVLAVDHHGHDAGGLALIGRRIRSGYAGGTGEVVRAGFGRAHGWAVGPGFAHFRHACVVIGWWLALLLLLVARQWAAALVLLLAPFTLLAWRRRSWRHGAYSVATWCMHGIGLLQGVVRRRVPPARALRYLTLQDGA